MNWLKYCEPENWRDEAKLYPIISDDELIELADDIRTNGLQNSIALYEGKILDGRNRILACRIAGAEPTFYDWKPKKGISPVVWALSQNSRRRHLTPSQKAFVALEVEKILAGRLSWHPKSGRKGPIGESATYVYTP
jgi:hypothetical protein